MNYYDWKESTVNCKGCGWVGKGAEADVREYFRDGSENCCPKCSHYFGFIPFPTFDEVRTDPRADPADKKSAEITLGRWRRFDEANLKSPSQLPDISPPPKALIWDVVETPSGEDYVVIRDGDRELWRELSFYENYERFGVVAGILKEKYPSLVDLEPTRVSWLDLYGDRLGAGNYVERVRAGLGCESLA